MTDLQISPLDAAMRDHDPARDEPVVPHTARADAIFRRALSDPTPDHSSRPERRARRRWQIILPTGGIAVAAAVTLLIVGLLGGSPSRGGWPHYLGVAPSNLTPTPTTVRAKLLAALDAAGNDVLEVQGSSTSDDPNATTCSSTHWFSPFDVASGQPFQERSQSTCTDGTTLDDAISISDPLVTPMKTSLPDPNGSGQQLFSDHIGVSVCGVGDETGYDGGYPTGRNGSFQASSVTLNTHADATPSLIESEISEGTLRVVGNTTVNGQEAIEISVTPSSGDQVASNWGSDTLWVDPTTYLLVQQVVTFTSQAVPSGVTGPPSASSGGQQTLQFTFLPPTSSNLGLLQLPIPSGLSAVPALNVVPAGACSVLAGR